MKVTNRPESYEAIWFSGYDLVNRDEVLEFLRSNFNADAVYWLPEIRNVNNEVTQAEVFHLMKFGDAGRYVVPRNRWIVCVKPGHAKKGSLPDSLALFDDEEFQKIYQEVKD